MTNMEKDIAAAIPNGNTTTNVIIWNTAKAPWSGKNISGGGGWVAWGQMSKWDAKKDDHKIGLVNLPHVFAYLDPKMKRTETVSDFNFIGGQTYDPCLWLVRADDERFTGGLKDVLAYTAKNPNKY